MSHRLSYERCADCLPLSCVDWEKKTRAARRRKKSQSGPFPFLTLGSPPIPPLALFFRANNTRTHPRRAQDYPLDIVKLSPGAKLAQTRRSIDVEGLSVREGPHPAFIILGGQKCGTTLLYECLNQHPLVMRGRRRETHFFDWSWPEAVAATHQKTTVDKLRTSCE